MAVPKPPAQPLGSAISNPAATHTGPHASITIGAHPIPAEAEAKHFLILGETGSGKSIAIGEMLHGALPRGDRAIIADPDGVYTKQHYTPARGDAIFNPFDERSVRWKFFSDIGNGRDAAQASRSLVARSVSTATRDWNANGATLLTGAVQGFLQRDPQDRSTQELHRVIAQGSSAELRTLLKDTDGEALFSRLSTEELALARGIAEAALRTPVHMERQQGADFSVREWVKQGGKGVLFLPYKATEIAALRNTIPTVVSAGMSETMDRQNDREPMWFFVEGPGAIGKINAMPGNLDRLGQSGGRVVLAFQSIEQVRQTYGEQDTNAIVKDIGNRLVLRGGFSMDGGTARFAAGMINERRASEAAPAPTSETDKTSAQEMQRNKDRTLSASEIERSRSLTGNLKLAFEQGWRPVTIKPRHFKSTVETAEPPDSNHDVPTVVAREQKLSARAVSAVIGTAKRVWKLTRLQQTGASAQAKDRTQGNARPLSRDNER